jgi:hypothetical protein
VAQVGASTASAHALLRDFVLVHLLSPVSDFAEKDGVMDFSLLRFLHTGQCYPTGLAPRVDLERERLQGRVFHAPVFEPNDERRHVVHDRTTTLQQESRPFGRTGHQRLLFLV